MSFVDHYVGERKQDWLTPDTLFMELQSRFNFTLDGACTEANKLLPRGSTLEASLAWQGERVFCNPPWTSIATFIELAPQADFACFLVPARVNAKWFHRALALGAKVEFFQGKPKFGGAKWNSPTDCLLLLFGAA